MKQIEYHSSQIIKVLEYLRDNESSQYTDRAPLIMSYKLQMDDDYLKKVLTILENRGAIYKTSKLDPASFVDINEDMFMYYDITKRGKLQLFLGTWNNKEKTKKRELTIEEKFEKRKARRETIQHRWIVLSIIGVVISIAYFIANYFFDYDVLREIKLWMTK